MECLTQLHLFIYVHGVYSLSTYYVPKHLLVSQTDRASVLISRRVQSLSRRLSLRDPMDYSMPGLPAYHHLGEGDSQC